MEKGHFNERDGHRTEANLLANQPNGIVNITLRNPWPKKRKEE